MAAEQIALDFGAPQPRGASRPRRREGPELCLDEATERLRTTRKLEGLLAELMQTEVALALTDNGHLDGQLLITVAGLDRLLPALGLDKLVAPGGKVDRFAGTLDRLMPGLGNVARERAGAGIAAGIGLLGEQTQLEGRRAVVLPLRISNGDMFLGGLAVGQINPLF